MVLLSDEQGGELFTYAQSNGGAALYQAEAYCSMYNNMHLGDNISLAEAAASAADQCDSGKFTWAPTQ